jgi:hypothetical protein
VTTAKDAGLRPGVRIRLLEMPADPHPIPAGMEGTVTHVANPDSAYEQVYVDWDDPTRTLMLIPSVDRFEVIEEQG